MPEQNANPETMSKQTESRFPHERLDAYNVARQLAAFVAKHRRQLRGLPGEAGSHFERAVVSSMLNIAEAAGRQGAADRARVFAIARGECFEAAAALDVARLYSALSSEQAAVARGLLVRLGQMLSRLSLPRKD